jgi:ABC-type amino acid transport substrate-binding protein
MHILALSLFSACAVGGLVVVRWRKLLRFGALTVVLTVLVLGAVRFTFEAIGHEYEKYELFIARELLYEPVPSKVLRELPDEIDRVDREKPVLDRIRERGFLRVGYLKDRLPFAFQNANGRLVGFDVEMAHALARQLGVKLELVRIDWKDMAPLLERHYLDIVMSGIAVTPERVEKMTFSAAYLDETLAFVVRDYRRDEFSSRKAVQSQKGLKIGILDTPYYVAKLKAYLPEAEVVILDSPREFFTTRSHELDALLYSAEGGSSWSLIYPQFTVAVPHPDVLKSPIAYPLARGDVELVSFVSTWISLKQKDRTIDRLFDYWIRGEQTTRKRPRWSVVRNVLKWVD